MEISGPGLVLRPVVPADVAALRDIHATPEVARWWGPPEPGWPLEEDEPGLLLLTMWRGDAIVGFIQAWEEGDPRYRYAAIDLFVDPAHHRQGIASEALRILVDHLVEVGGHHRITIDPALDNAPAIACYAGVGFSPVGVLRAYERDPASGEWRDALLMEQVRLPTQPAPATVPDIRLRPATEADLAAILAAERSDAARPFVGQYTRDRHAAAIADPAEELLVIAGADGTFAGYVLLGGIADAHTGVELRRIVVARPGEGIGGAALAQVLERAFTAHRTHRVWLDVRIDNHRARRAYAAAGFRTDGILREAMAVDGVRHHQLLLSLLAREWSAAS